MRGVLFMCETAYVAFVVILANATGNRSVTPTVAELLLVAQNGSATGVSRLPLSGA